MKGVIIEIDGGTVVGCHNNSNIPVYIVDWDIAECEGEVVMMEESGLPWEYVDMVEGGIKPEDAIDLFIADWEGQG